jgi:hypothetical protein
MKTQEYTNPKEAYDLMNLWTRIKTSYQTQFHGKDVTKVDIMFEGDQPRFASVHYKKGLHIGFDSIDLSNKILLDKPDKPTLDLRLVTQE